MTTQEHTKRILNDDCHAYREYAVEKGTIEAADLYEKHILLLEAYVLGRRVLH